jgi:hypothetical protein
MRNLVLERGFRRADLSALQRFERLAKRRACQFGFIAPQLISIDTRAAFLEPNWSLFWPVSTSFTPQPTGTIRRSNLDRTG